MSSRAVRPSAASDPSDGSVHPDALERRTAPATAPAVAEMHSTPTDRARMHFERAAFAAAMAARGGEGMLSAAHEAQLAMMDGLFLLRHEEMTN